LSLTGQYCVTMWLFLLDQFLSGSRFIADDGSGEAGSFC